MKRILINATQSEELRVAMVNGQLLYDLDIEVPSREQKKSNIYKGVITRVEPSLEAAFVNYGGERHGFLPFKEISRIYFSDNAKDSNGKYNIKDAVKVDQEIIVQVEKEERGNKGAALTSFVSLAGRFLVAMPQNPRAGGVSRRIEGEDRDQVRKVMSELEMPAGMGVIARTAGVGRSTEEMQWDLDYLCQLWTAIEQASEEKKAPFLIYQESDIVIRALRDHYKSEVGEILIDSQQAFDRAHEFMSMVMPNAVHKLKKFEDNQPLFNRYQIENQIESAFNRTVTLPSGGAIVIDHTEALTSIDVNSARATKGGDIEETALSTNLEAADEIARQLRIRDLGGLVVIDFIDMMKNKNQRDVEQRLRKAVYDDRARVQIGRISRFGLLEMSRQRLRPSLGESSQIVCPRCSGQGTIRDIESLSLAVLRLLEEEALKENTGRILAKLPVECATYLLNEKRSKIAGIEDRNKVNCLIIPDVNLETPHFTIERVRDNDTVRHESSYKSSYEMASEEAPGYTPETKPTAAPVPPAAAVQRIKPPEAPKQAIAKVEKPDGLITKVISALFGRSEKEKEEEKAAPQESTQRPRRNANRQRNRPGQGRNNRNQKNSRQKDGKETDQQSEVNQNSQKDQGENRRKPRTNRSRNSQRRAPGNRQTVDQKNQPTAQDDQAEVNGADQSSSANTAENKPSKRPRRPRSNPRRDKSVQTQSDSGNSDKNTTENSQPSSNQSQRVKSDAAIAESTPGNDEQRTSKESGSNAQPLTQPKEPVKQQDTSVPEQKTHHSEQKNDSNTAAKPDASSEQKSAPSNPSPKDSGGSAPKQQQKTDTALPVKKAEPEAATSTTAPRSDNSSSNTGAERQSPPAPKSEVTSSPNADNKLQTRIPEIPQAQKKDESTAE